MRCLQDSVEKGYPSSVCDQRKTQQQCLYVDGAAWSEVAVKKGFGYWMGILGQLILGLLVNLGILLLGISWKVTCKTFLNGIVRDLKDVLLNGEIIACELAGSAIMLTELNGFSTNLWDWEDYNNKLYFDSDPCAGLDWSTSSGGGASADAGDDALELEVSSW